MAGADVNAQDSVTGYTPLHVALLRIRYQSPPKPENLSMINLLLSNGADSSIVADDGTSALDIDEHQVTRHLRLTVSLCTARCCMSRVPG